MTVPAAAKYRRLRKYVPRRVLNLRTAYLATRNLLKTQGLYRSIASGRPQAPDGSAIPWFTYGAIAYLEQFDLSSRDVFEFGSGNSTIFWQTRTRSVVSVEDDPQWFGEIHSQIDSARVRHTLVIEKDEYVSSVSHGEYDIIVIDGSHREACVSPALAALRTGGFIVLDNADWFPAQAAQLRSAGLLEIDFTGFGPINQYTSTTSLFMRRDVDLRPLGVQPMVGAGGMPQNVRVADSNAGAAD
jgi:hypothetical protein